MSAHVDKLLGNLGLNIGNLVEKSLSISSDTTIYDALGLFHLGCDFDFIAFLVEFLGFITQSKSLFCVLSD